MLNVEDTEHVVDMLTQKYCTLEEICDEVESLDPDNFFDVLDHITEVLGLTVSAIYNGDAYKVIDSVEI